MRQRWHLGGWTRVVDTEPCCDAETLQEQTATLSMTNTYSTAVLQLHISLTEVSVGGMLMMMCWMLMVAPPTLMTSCWAEGGWAITWPGGCKDTKDTDRL